MKDISEHTLIQSFVSITTSSTVEFQFLFEILNNATYPQVTHVTMQIFLLKHHMAET